MWFWTDCATKKMLQEFCLLFALISSAHPGLVDIFPSFFFFFFCESIPSLIQKTTLYKRRELEMKLKGTKREVLDRLLCFLGKQRGKPDSTLCSFSFLSRVKLSFSFNRYSDLVVSVLANHFVISLNSEDSKT